MLIKPGLFSSFHSCIVNILINEQVWFVVLYFGWITRKVVFLSKVLTERFSFLKEIKPRKIVVSRFEVWSKSIYPLQLSQSMESVIHSFNCDRIVEKQQNMALRNFLDNKFFFLHVIAFLTCFQSEKITKLTWLHAKLFAETPYKTC